MSNKYNLDFGSNNGFSIGVSNAGIAFRNMTIKALGYPERVNIGINKENGIIGVKVAREPDKFIKSYAFCNNRSKKSWLRITSRPIVRAIEEITGITYGGKSIYYAAYYDNEEKMLIVNLKKKKEDKQ